MRRTLRKGRGVERPKKVEGGSSSRLLLSLRATRSERENSSPPSVRDVELPEVEILEGALKEERKVLISDCPFYDERKVEWLTSCLASQ